jgi:signal transduction histidine kinase
LALIALRPELTTPATASAFELFTDSAIVPAAVTAAALAWIRSRVNGDNLARWEAAGFTLAAAMACALLIIGFGLRAEHLQIPDAAVGLTRAPLAIVVLVGAFAFVGPAQRPLESIGATVGGALFAWSAVALGAGVVMPQIAPGWFPDQSTLVAQGELFARLGAAGVALIFLAGALAYRRVVRRTSDVAHAAMSAGLLLAAASEFYLVIGPREIAPNVMADDVLRILFYTVALGGSIIALVRYSLAERTADGAPPAIERAALDERRRIAREMHDGMAQDLVAARLGIAELALSMREAPMTALLERADHAIARALLETRIALETLRDERTEPGSLYDGLAAQMTTFQRRFGVTGTVHVRGNRRLAPSAIETVTGTARSMLQAVGMGYRPARARLDCAVSRHDVALSVSAPLAQDSVGEEQAIEGIWDDAAILLEQLADHVRAASGTLEIYERGGIAIRVALPLARTTTPRAASLRRKRGVSRPRNRRANTRQHRLASGS